MFEKYEETHTYSSLNRDILNDSDLCVCFFCEKSFSPVEIQEWIDDNKTALCPKCGIDSVLPRSDKYDIEDKKFISEMYKFWFTYESINNE